MSLTIDRLVTRCHIPRRIRVDMARLEEIARQDFLRECARRMESLPGGHSGVCRIKRLHVRLRLTPADLGGALLPEAWAAALTRALLEAMAGGSGTGAAEVVHAESRAAWLARAVVDLLAGIAGQRWEYEEFRGLLGQSTASAALGMLLAEPSELADTLSLLEAHGALERLLAQLDELAAEQLLAAVSKLAAPVEPTPTLDDLLLVGRAVAGDNLPLSRHSLTDRRLALRIYCLLRRTQSHEQGAGLAPRRILYALQGLSMLLNLATLSGVEAVFDLDATEIERLLGSPLHPGACAVLNDLRDRDQIGGHGARAEVLRSLQPVVDRLETFAIVAVPDAGKNPRWVTSDCGGLFLLVGLLERLDWPKRLLRGSVAALPADHIVRYFLAGLGLAIVGKFTRAPDRLDPGLLLFAGFGQEPDLAGLRSFYAAEATEGRQKLLEELLGSAAAAASSARTWEATLDLLADHLVRAFGSKVRGFQRSSRRFVIECLLALPGRIRVEERRLRVVLAPSAFLVALHVSGTDTPVNAVPWLGDRDVAFELEGL